MTSDNGFVVLMTLAGIVAGLFLLFVSYDAGEKRVCADAEIALKYAADYDALDVLKALGVCP